MWALEQDSMSSNPRSTTYQQGEFGLQFPLLQKDLIHKIVVTFKKVSAPTHTHTKNT